MIFETTPSQTVGPYFAIGLPWELGPLAVSEDAPGAIRITGTVYDGAGTPVPDFLLETCDPRLVRMELEARRLKPSGVAHLALPYLPGWVGSMPYLQRHGAVLASAAG